ncbi:hypothetical protein EMPS_04310 [Entomortierella parvispora]|uniref:F-box domain-containing protein n=1 Tax=Entomortierella parvispora TaxID=205924 RepID=A0A9P3H8U8_9FUNG|nr:hypothetical protein EMPS_04310 [Entomortierella parvispora]
MAPTTVTVFTHQALFLFDILNQIQPFLSLQDLSRSTQVCRQWHQFFHQVLWRSVAISESRHRPDFLDSLVKNLGWVHSLKWDYTEWWEMHHVSRYSLPSSPTTRAAIQPTVMSTNRAQTTKQIDVLPVPAPVLTPPQSTYPTSSSRVSPASFSSSSSCSSFNPTVSSASPTEAVAGTSLVGARTRLQYHPPTQISFPTRQTLQQLGLNHAHALQDLVLEGPFELIPLLRALACANHYPRYQQQQHHHPLCSHPSFSPDSNGNTMLRGCSDASGDHNGPRLRRLRLKNTNCQRRETVPFQDLFRVSPVLEEFALKTHAQIIVSESSEDDLSLQQQQQQLRREEERSPLRLKKLELDVRALTGPQLWVILRQCPDLEMFSLTDYGGIHPVQSFKKELSSLGSLESEVGAVSKVQPHRDSKYPTLTRTRPMTNIVAWIRSMGGQDPSRTLSSLSTASYRNASYFKQASQVPVPKVPQVPDAHKFLASLPKLTHLGMDSICFGDVCLSALEKYCPRLTSLDIGRQISGIPPRSPTSPSFESPVSPSLFSTSLSSPAPPSGQIQSSTLQTFLCSPGARHLKHLRVRGLRLHAEDMLSPRTGILQPWACSPHLETLSIAFGTGLLSSPNSSPLTSPNLSADPSMTAPLSPAIPLLYSHLFSQPSLTLQESLEQIVYSQLAQLRQIQILEIRPSASFFRLRISPSGRSGLELLADLNKTLEEFSMAMSAQPQPPPSTVPGGPTATTAVTAAEERKALHEWFELYWPDVKKIQVVSSRERGFQPTAPSHPGAVGLGITTAAASTVSAASSASSGSRSRNSADASSSNSRDLSDENCNTTNYWSGFLSQPPPPRASRV